VIELDVIDDPAVAAVALEPLRARVLAALAEPGSATTVATALGESRQKVNYHLRALEDAGLVELVEQRPRRGLTERVVRATARRYVISPSVLADAGTQPPPADRLSTEYLLVVAARVIREVAELAKRARAARKSLPTLTIDTEIRFGSAASRAAFTSELSEAVRALAARYHDESTHAGRWHRVVVVAHPVAPPAPGEQGATP
jgi:DNA-binding transcriptional ArsR family regulator